MPPKVVRGVLRRPAAAPKRVRKPAMKVKQDEAAKGFKKFTEMDVRNLPKLGPVVLQEARYYGQPAPVAGHFTGLVVEGENFYAKLKVSGTKNEELLRVLSGKRDRLVSIHLCEEGCGEQLTDEVLLHAQGFEETALARVPWLTNLQEAKEAAEEVDEMAELRKELEKREKEKKEHAKKEEAKENRRKKKKEREEGRASKSPKQDREDRESGQKPLEDFFKHTGMDPDPSRRGKVLKRARRIGKRGKKKNKKKDKGSSSSGRSSASSSTSSDSSDYGEEGLFEEEKRLRAIWKKCPGALAARSIQEIKKILVTAAGTLWDVNKATLPPLYTQYGRQVVMPAMSASLQQESLTLCQALDLLAQGHAAACMDLLNQRLKSLEALSKGAHWTVCRQHELIKIDEGGMAEEQERLGAARRAKEEERLKALLQRAPGGKGNEATPGGKNRKGRDSKGATKGSSGESGKGKGQGGREEQKGSWQKKSDK